MSNKVDAIDMKQREKSELKPKLRFSEFRNAPGWMPIVLDSKVTKVGSGITPKGGEKNYKNEGIPFIRSQNVGWGELILDDVAFIDKATHGTFLSTEIVEGDVLLNITGASIGRSVVADSRIHGRNVNQHVCIIRTKAKELNSRFLNQFILSHYGQKQIDSFQAGGNRQGLNFAQVRSFSIPLPQIPEEMTRVADCLSSIDELIAAHSQKLDALNDHKKGLLQQLFPAEGETVPQLRFPEFRDAGEWEEKQLESICHMQAGQYVAAADISEQNEKGLYPCYGGNGLRGYTKTYTHSGTYPLIGRQGALCGNVKLGTERFHATEHAVVTTPKDNIDVEWLFYNLVRLNLNQYATGQAQPGLSVAVLEKVSTVVPMDIKEQQKIADSLTAVDERIVVESEKIEALNTYKKGLMQQLFPSPDEVWE